MEQINRNNRHEQWNGINAIKLLSKQKQKHTLKTIDDDVAFIDKCFNQRQLLLSRSRQEDDESLNKVLYA